MNINQQASVLQGLNDQQLQMAMKSPPSGVPQFLVLSEMQRRQKMRAEAAPVAPPNPTTVAEDIQAQGVAGMPQMATGEDTPGGVASFAGGGSVGFPNSSYPSGGPPDVENWEFEDSPMGRYWKRVKQQMSRSFDMPNPDKPVGETVGNAVRSGVKGAFSGVGKGLRDIDAEVGRSQRELLGVPHALDNYVGDTQRFNVDRWKQAGVMNDKPNVVDFKMSSEPDNMIRRPGIDARVPEDAEPVVAMPGARSGARGVSGGIAALGKTSGVTPQPAEAGQRNMPPMVPPDRIPDPRVESPEAYMEMAAKYMPDHSGEIVGRMDQRLAENEKGRKDALNMALMQAGLGIMSAGSKSGNFLGALGEGGIGGLQSYAEGIRGVRERGDKISQQRDAAIMAQDAAKAGRFKTAADIANQANTRNIALHQGNAAERRADMDMQQRDRQFDVQMGKMDQDLLLRRELMANQEKIARIHAGATLGAAGMRAGSGGVSGIKPEKMATLIKSERDALVRANPMPFGGDSAMYFAQMEQLAEARVRARLSGTSGVMSIPQQNVAGHLTTKGFVER